MGLDEMLSVPRYSQHAGNSHNKRHVEFGTAMGDVWYQRWWEEVKLCAVVLSGIMEAGCASFIPCYTKMQINLNGDFNILPAV